MNKTIPVITIIVANYNGGKYIKSCLESILKSTFKDFEIIVVDDGSKDNSRSVLKLFEKEKKLKIFYLKKNKGASYARNFGVKRAKGKYILFIDSDCEIDNNCLNVIEEKFNKNNKIGALSLKLIKDNGKLDSVGHFYSIFGYPYELGADENHDRYQNEMIVFAAKTAGLAIIKNLFNKIQGFDKDYTIYGEDTDLSWRIWLSGYVLLYIPKANIYHHQKGSLNKLTNHRILYEGTKNNLSNLIKNGSINVLLWLIPLHIFFLQILSLKLVFQLRITDSLWIYKGIIWNIFNIGKTLKKRRQILKYKRNDVSKIMFGPINYLLLVKKGWRWFLNV